MAKPVRITRKGDVAAKTPREPLFYLPDPDDPDKEIEFTIPVTVPPQFTMQYLRDLRTMAPETAIARMLDRLLGRAAVDALANSDDVTVEDMAAIMRVIEKKTTAAIEAVRGN